MIDLTRLCALKYGILIQEIIHTIFRAQTILCFWIGLVPPYFNYLRRFHAAILNMSLLVSVTMCSESTWIIDNHCASRRLAVFDREFLRLECSICSICFSQKLFWKFAPLFYYDSQCLNIYIICCARANVHRIGSQNCKTILLLEGRRNDLARAEECTDVELGPRVLMAIKWYQSR